MALAPDGHHNMNCISLPLTKAGERSANVTSVFVHVIVSKPVRWAK